MAHIKTHCEDCFRILGQEFENVHRWLDAKAQKYPPPLFLEYHRKFRHNDKGVKIVKKKWGLLAADAAKIHIIRDLELYVLKEEFHKAVNYDNIETLYQIALKYCHDWQGPLDERWLK
jgi:hypothetical protein